MASIKIVNMHGREVTGSCSFEFKDYKISVSNVFSMASDRVLVMDADGNDLFTCFTVDEAVSRIEQRVIAQQAEA